MSSGTNTPNLGLHVWVGTDYVLRTEFNDNFAAIDTWAGKTTTKAASARNIQITGTTAQQIFTFTPTVSGIYSLKLYIRVAIAATNVTATLAYADSGGPQSYTPNGANNTSLSVGSHNVIAYEFEAVSGTAVTLNITAATANQVFVTAALVNIA